MSKRRKTNSLLIIAISTLVVLIAASLVIRARETEARRVSNEALYSSTPKSSEEYGYVSSDRCISCHPGEHKSWHDSFHRTMTQVATPETVLGDFNNVSLPYFGRTFHLHREGDEFYIGEKESRARVVQTTGSHHYQMYWINKNGLLTAFPMVYLLDEERWVRRNDVFMVPPRFNEVPEGVRIWNDSCITCHSTLGQPKLKPNASQRDARADTAVAELGIACEACHGPGRDHIELYSNPVTRYGKHVLGTGDPKIINPANLASKESSQICGQCHGITQQVDLESWNRCGFAYRPGDKLSDSRVVARHPALSGEPIQSQDELDFLDKYFWRDGMVRVSGREFNGLQESPCYQNGELSCISCHSMHDSDPNDQLRRDAENNEACLQCHTEISDIQDHTHHAASSHGSLCYNCHMPHTTFGLVKAIRSHQVSSPSVDESIETGRPNACNACHLDKTLQWTSEHLADWYGQTPADLNEQHQSVSAALLWTLKGDGGQRAVTAWHMGWKPALEASGNDWQAPFLAELLDDPYPVVRSIAGRSLAKLPQFGEFEYDYTDTSAIERKSREARERWLAPTASKSNCLLDKDGNVIESTLQKILKQRDNRPMDLLE